MNRDEIEELAATLRLKFVAALAPIPPEHRREFLLGCIAGLLLEQGLSNDQLHAEFSRALRDVEEAVPGKVTH